MSVNYAPHACDDELVAMTLKYSFARMQRANRSSAMTLIYRKYIEASETTFKYRDITGSFVIMGDYGFYIVTYANVAGVRSDIKLSPICAPCAMVPTVLALYRLFTAVELVV